MAEGRGREQRRRAEPEGRGRGQRWRAEEEGRVRGAMSVGWKKEGLFL